MADLIEYQKKAASWLEWACGPKHAVAETDPRYQQVTEGRDKPTKGYSSCGDLAHWLYFRLGFRLPWVNRAEHLGWRLRRNVSALCWPPAPARDHAPDDKFEAGDVFILWGRHDTRDAHVVCAVDHIPEQRVLLTAEYGQPGGALKNHLYRVDAHGHIVLGTRTIHRVVPLEAVLAQARQTSDLVPPEEPPPWQG